MPIAEFWRSISEALRDRRYSSRVGSGDFPNGDGLIVEGIDKFVLTIGPSAAMFFEASGVGGSVDESKSSGCAAYNGSAGSEICLDFSDEHSCRVFSLKFLDFSNRPSSAEAPTSSKSEIIPHPALDWLDGEWPREAGGEMPPDFAFCEFPGVVLRNKASIASVDTK